MSLVEIWISKLNKSWVYLNHVTTPKSKVLCHAISWALILLSQLQSLESFIVLNHVMFFKSKVFTVLKSKAMCTHLSPIETWDSWVEKLSWL